MSTTPPPFDEARATPTPEGGERLSMALSEADFATSRSSLSISGPQWMLPEDFDQSRYESESVLSQIIKIQAYMRQAAVIEHYNLILKLHRKRTRVAKEIWNSETTYLEGLMAMYQFFYLPLTKISKEPNAFVTEDQVKLLFGNLQTLMDQAKKMNTHFAKVVNSYTPHSKLGWIFTDNAEQLKDAFTPYVDPFDEANALFLTLRKDNEKFREWLQGIEFKAVDLGLESYLIMPIQRVTRYGLLLRELIHQTWQDHDDYESLNAALSAVERVASHVNGHKKKVIMQNKIKSIIASIVGIPEIAANEERMYITEGPVTDLGDSIPVTHHIFLFSDLMIWTQMINKKKFMFRKMNWLKDSTAEAVEKSNSFRVITNDWTNTVFTKTKEDQNKWLAYLENENFTPSSEKGKPHQTKRPDGAIFLSHKKQVEESLKRGMKRRNAGSQLRGPKSSGAKPGSTKARKEGSSGSKEEDGKKSGSSDKDKSRKIPRGYATVDAKMLEEVKAAKELARGAAKVGKEGKFDSKDGTAKEGVKEKDASTDGRSSPAGSGKMEKSRDPLKVLTKKPKGKKGETITPELLEALRATRTMSDADQAAYLAKLQKEGHSSLPPSLLPASSSSAPSAHEGNASGSAGGVDGEMASSLKMRPITISGSSSSVGSGSATESMSGDGTVNASKSWHKGPPPPMPDVSHVKRASISITTSNTGTFGSRIRTSTSLSTGSAADFAKPRGGSVSASSTSTPPVSRPVSYAPATISSSNGSFVATASSNGAYGTAPSSSNGSGAATGATDAASSSQTPSSPSVARPTRQVPVAKRSSTESLTDAAKRRSGSVNVSPKPSQM